MLALFRLKCRTGLFLQEAEFVGSLAYDNKKVKQHDSRQYGSTRHPNASQR